MKQGVDTMYPVYPDVKRMYLVDAASAAASDDQYDLLVGLLKCYDKGKIDLAIDPWDGCVKVRTLEIQ